MTKRDLVIDLARSRGALRPRDLPAIGVDASYLRRLAAEGVVHRNGRGLYTLSAYDVTTHHSLVEAVQASPGSVVCLLSALMFHGLGTQLPPQVWLSVRYGAWIPRNSSVSTHVVVMRSPSFEAGVETHRIEGIDVPIYSIAKTIADCFKFRGKIGTDVALEALAEALREKRCSRDEIRQFARIDRVERIMSPYLEALSL